MSTMNFSAAHTALLLLEIQREYTSGDGAFYKSVAAGNILPHIRKTTEAARNAGCTIIHIPRYAGPQLVQEPFNRPGFPEMIKKHNAFDPDSEQFKFDVNSLPTGNDLVVHGMSRFSAFAGTHLDLILRSRNIKTLVAAGFTKYLSVESTLRQGYDLGYECMLLSDCTAGLKENGIPKPADTFQHFANVLEHRQFIDLLQPPGEVVMSGRSYTE